MAGEGTYGAVLWAAGKDAAAVFTDAMLGEQAALLVMIMAITVLTIWLLVHELSRDQPRVYRIDPISGYPGLGARRADMAAVRVQHNTLQLTPLERRRYDQALHRTSTLSLVDEALSIVDTKSTLFNNPLRLLKAKAAQEAYAALLVACEETRPQRREAGLTRAIQMDPGSVPALVLTAWGKSSSHNEVAKALARASLTASAQLPSKGEPCKWADPPWRCYLHVQMELATALRRAGTPSSVAAAVEILKELLTHPGVTETSANVPIHLFESYLELKQYDNAKGVYDEHPDMFGRSAVGYFTAAFFEAITVAPHFAKGGTGNVLYVSEQEMFDAISALLLAMEYNPHVLEYLIDMRQLSVPPNHFVERGDTEALCYAFRFRRHWQAVEGACMWLEFCWTTHRQPLSALANYWPDVYSFDLVLATSLHEVHAHPAHRTSTTALSTHTIAFFALCAYLLILGIGALVATLLPKQRDYAADIILNTSATLKAYISRPPWFLSPANAIQALTGGKAVA